MRRWSAIVVLAGGLFAACVVDDTFLTTGYFPCASPADCGDGWGCLQATPYAANFCAPLCGTEPCGGVCLGGDLPVCLRNCLIAEDGSPGPCQGDAFSCIRTSVASDIGVCYPVRSCVRHADCEASEACLTQLLREWNPRSSLPLDNLYCVPTATAARACPPGSRRSPQVSPTAFDMCVADCTLLNTRCPLGMGCLTQLSHIAPYLPEVMGPTCVLGSYGLSCEDSTNCFVGSCHDTRTAQGQICTMTCNEASRLARGCEFLVNPFSDSGSLFTMECDASAPSGDGSGLCVVRYAINFPGCTIASGSAYECASELFCKVDGMVSTCTRDCIVDDDCNRRLGVDQRRWYYECYYADPLGPTGLCRFKPSPAP